MIPQSAWSAPALALLQYIPLANQGGTIFSSSAENESLRDDKGAMRADAATRWGTISAYYFADDYRLDNPYPTGQGGANVPGFNAISQGRAQLFSLGFTKTFSASAINEVHFSYMRNANNIGAPVGGVGPSLASQGFLTGEGTVGIVPLNPSIEGIENVSLNNLTFGVDVTGLTQASNTYQWSDVFTRVIGRHTWRFGGSFHLDQINTNPDTASNGSFAFRGTETGLDFADFLLGVASSYSQADSKSFDPRNKYVGLFAQDTFRVAPNLRWNYGVRWDVLPGWREKYNQFHVGVRGAVDGVYWGAAGTGVSRRSGSAVNAGAYEVHKSRAAVRSGVFAGASGGMVAQAVRLGSGDSSRRRIWDLLCSVRGVVRGDYERESAVRLRLHESGAGPVRDAVCLRSKW